MGKLIAKGELNELEEQGLIQSFEYTHELAWKTLKDFLEHSGNIDIYGSKDATREEIEEKTGKPVVSTKNVKQLK